MSEDRSVDCDESRAFREVIFGFKPQRQRTNNQSASNTSYKHAFSFEYCNNSIRTTKYSLVNFLPKSLFEQFQKVANLYFLCVCVLMVIGTETTLFDSPLAPWSELAILALMITISITKGGIEDYRRYCCDSEINSRSAMTLLTRSSSALMASRYVINHIDSAESGDSILAKGSELESSGYFERAAWSEVQVGDVLLVRNDEEIPADMVLLSSSNVEKIGKLSTDVGGEDDSRIDSEPNHGRAPELSVAFVQTANIDGESNLKIKNTVSNHSGFNWNTIADLLRFDMRIRCDLPNSNIHSFHGTMIINGRETGLSAKNLILRGSRLRHTDWILGVVVYTGRDTKVMRNSRSVPFKLSTMEQLMNQIIVLILCAQVMLSVLSTILYVWWNLRAADDLLYLCRNISDADEVVSFIALCDTHEIYSVGSYLFTFFILYSNVVPISLYVTVEICTMFHSYFLQKDVTMYDTASDTCAQARSSNMNADLGTIQYLLTDKTGTLTENDMKFRQCSVLGTLYSDSKFSRSAKNGEIKPSVHEKEEKLSDIQSLAVLAELATENNTSEGSVQWTASEFIVAMAVCHTVVISADTGQMQAESADEQALLLAAKQMGFRFVGRESGDILIARRRATNFSSNKLNKENPFQSHLGEDVNDSDSLQSEEIVRYTLLATIPFDSIRKRMSVIVRCPDGKIVVYCKGADEVISKLSTGSQQSSEDIVDNLLESHINFFASNGLRTLLLGRRELSAQDYQEFAKCWTKVENALQSTQYQLLVNAAALVENSITVLGATAVEDKLQDGVADTLLSLIEAGINVWVLTGDKMETAINIGYASNLLTDEMVLIKLSNKEESPPQVYNKLQSLLRFFETVRVGIGRDGGLEQWRAQRDAFFESLDVSSVAASDDALEDGLTEDTPLLYRSSRSPALNELRSEHLALVVDGEALISIFGHAKSEQAFFLLARMCRAVIACRVSPEQKRLMVRLLKRSKHYRSLGSSDNKHFAFPRPYSCPVTLAIGDGANDVAMLQEAQIGVGINGKEGRQAVNASDFSIGQFRFLRTMLLVHGRTDYRRLCKVVTYSFYKNLVLTFVVFYFTFYSGYSSESIFDIYVHSMYNIILAFPVIALGILDRDMEAKTLLRYPFLYVCGREQWDLNFSVVLRQIFQAILDSAVIFFIPLIVYSYSTDAWSAEGYTSGLWVFGLVIYNCLVAAMFIRIILLTHNWNWLSILLFMLSVLGLVIFLLVYQYTILVSWEFGGSTNEMYSQLMFWLLLIVVPVTSMLIQLTYDLVRKEFFPTITDIAEEFDQLLASYRGAAYSSIPGDELEETEGDTNNLHNLFGLRSKDSSTSQHLRSIESMLTRIFTIGQNFNIDWSMLSEQWALLSSIDQEQLGLHNLKQSASLVTRDSSLPINADTNEEDQCSNSSSAETGCCQTRRELQFPPQRPSDGNPDREL